MVFFFDLFYSKHFGAVIINDNVVEELAVHRVAAPKEADPGHRWVSSTASAFGSASSPHPRV